MRSVLTIDTGSQLRHVVFQFGPLHLRLLAEVVVDTDFERQPVAGLLAKRLHLVIVHRSTLDFKRCDRCLAELVPVEGRLVDGVVPCLRKRELHVSVAALEAQTSLR